jgi:hypothetical protein
MIIKFVLPTEKEREMEYKLFWVCAFEKELKKKDEEEKCPKIVLMPKIVIAKDDKSAAIKALRDEESLKTVDIDRLEIAVRPF